MGDTALARPSFENFRINLMMWLHLRRMSLSELADAMGKTPGQVSRWKNGHVEPSLDNIDQIARALRIAPLWLLMDSTDEHATDARRHLEAVQFAQMADLEQELQSKIDEIRTRAGDLSPEEFQVEAAKAKFALLDRMKAESRAKRKKPSKTKTKPKRDP